MTQTAKNNLKRIVLLLLLLAAVLVYALVPAVHDWVGTVLKMFSSGDFTQLRDFIRSYEGWAILVSFLLMIFQSLAEDDLRRGFLQPADSMVTDRPVTTVNIPVIRDGEALKEHIFETWRRAQVTVSGKPAGRLHLLWERFSSQTLNQMVFLLWKTGILKISYGEEGVEHQFGRKSA